MAALDTLASSPEGTYGGPSPICNGTDTWRHRVSHGWRSGWHTWGLETIPRGSSSML
jgi:hypothetical protein